MPPRPPRGHRVVAEPLGINITAESFTQEGGNRFGPVERSGIPELLGGLHVFGICAHVEVGTLVFVGSAPEQGSSLAIETMALPPTDVADFFLANADAG